VFCGWDKVDTRLVKERSLVINPPISGQLVGGPQIERNITDLIAKDTESSHPFMFYCDRIYHSENLPQ
jgi:hypothetical protein